MVAIQHQANPEPRPGGPFPRQHRITKKADFTRVFRNPRVSADHCFRVLARHSVGTGPRLGLAVSRRVDKRATVRNRIKRVIRESFRQHFLSRKAVGSHADPHSRAGITGEAGVDFVVIPRAEAARSSNARLFRSLEAHWARLEKQIEG